MTSKSRRLSNLEHKMEGLETPASARMRGRIDALSDRADRLGEHDLARCIRLARRTENKVARQDVEIDQLWEALDALTEMADGS